MQRQQNKIAGALITIAGGAFWGLSGACGQYLFEYKEASARWLVPIRLVVAGYLMLIFLLAKDRKTTLSVWKNKKNALDLVIYGIVGMMLCQYTYFMTIQLSNAGTATVLQYLGPVLIMLVICLREKKLPSVVEMVAMCLALLGVFFIASHGNVNHMIISKQALIYGLLSAVAVVVYNLQPQNLMKEFSTPLLLAWGMSIGGTVLFIMLKPWHYAPIVDVQTLLAMVVIILLGTILSFSFYMQGVKLIGATRASLYACVEPLVATILSFLWLKGSFGKMDLLGFVFIMSTIFILALPVKTVKLHKVEKQTI